MLTHMGHDVRTRITATMSRSRIVLCADAPSGGGSWVSDIA